MTTAGEMRQALHDAGMPAPLISAVETKLTDEDLKQRYLAASELLAETRALIVYGGDAPQKEEIVAKLLRRYMYSKSKTGRWMTPVDVPTQYQDLRGAGVVAFISIDLLTVAQAKVVAQAVRDWVSRGRAIILSVSSEAALRKVFGDDLVGYLSHCSAAVTISIKPLKQVKG